MKDVSMQEWSPCVQESSLLNCYCTFKTTLQMEPYLHQIKSSKLRRFLTKFRCSASELKIVSQRRSFPSNLSDAMCPLCGDGLEDEYHSLLVCPFYLNLRNKYIPQYYHKYPSKQKFVQLLSSHDIITVKNLALYVSKMFMTRNAIFVNRVL